MHLEYSYMVVHGVYIAVYIATCGYTNIQPPSNCQEGTRDFATSLFRPSEEKETHCLSTAMIRTSVPTDLDSVQLSSPLGCADWVQLDRKISSQRIECGTPTVIPRSYHGPIVPFSQLEGLIPPYKQYAFISGGYIREVLMSFIAICPY